MLNKIILQNERHNKAGNLDKNLKSKMPCKNSQNIAILLLIIHLNVIKYISLHYGNFI